MVIQSTEEQYEMFSDRLARCIGKAVLLESARGELMDDRSKTDNAAVDIRKYNQDDINRIADSFEDYNNEEILFVHAFSLPLTPVN